MKVYSSHDIKVLEECAVQSGVTMEQLMEKAGSAVAAFTARQMDVSGKIVTILCGKGNNGGDGFVCARRLFKMGAKVTVILACGEPSTELARNAYKLMPAGINILKWDSTDPKFPGKLRCEEALDRSHVVIDSIFGFGFTGKIEGSLARLVVKASSVMALKIAVDIPSGAQCDTGKVEGACFTADYTVTFTGIKPANVLYPSTSYCGKNIIAPVGIDKSAVEAYPSTFSVIKEKDIAPKLPKRHPQSNKGDFGRLLMICGSYGMIGACIMAAKGALRSGVGLLNIVVTKDIYPMIAPAVPEAIFTILDFTDENTARISSEKLYEALSSASACLVGCGLGAEAARYVPTVLKFSRGPVILDADGINYIAKNLEELSLAKVPVILTPHPGEMARLLQKTAYLIQDDRYNIATKFAREQGVFTVLKGAGTLIAAPDGEVLMNISGNPGMSKGGSGDVLAGIIASLCAQNLAPLDACGLGVYVHGKAGDLYASELGQTSMLPTDLIDYLPKVFKAIEDVKKL